MILPLPLSKAAVGRSALPSELHRSLQFGGERPASSWVLRSGERSLAWLGVLVHISFLNFVEYGPVTLTVVGVATLPQQFMSFYRQRAGADTSDLIGGNALLNYRVGIDSAHSTVYFDRRASYVAPGIDVIGLTLRPERDGRYTVIGAPEYAGRPAVPDAKAGDVLVSIDKVPAKGSTMGQI